MKKNKIITKKKYKYLSKLKQSEDKINAKNYVTNDV